MPLQRLLLLEDEPATLLLNPHESSLALLALRAPRRRVSRCPRLHLHQLSVDVAFGLQEAMLQIGMDISNMVEVIQNERHLLSEGRSNDIVLIRPLSRRDNPAGFLLENGSEPPVRLIVTLMWVLMLASKVHLHSSTPRFKYLGLMRGANGDEKTPAPRPG